MHITYRYEKHLSYVDISSSYLSLASRSPMALIDRRITDLKNEQESIQRICVKLSRFLRANSITPVNDDMIEYLRLFLNEEKQKQTSNYDNADIIRGIEQMIADYTLQMSLFSNSSANLNERSDSDQFNDPKSIEEIFDLVQELYALPINGDQSKNRLQK